MQAKPDADRWAAGWVVLGKAVRAGVPDIAARAATDLAAMRDVAWPVPPEMDAFVDILQVSGLIDPARPTTR